jgi:hypothetical protein
VVGAQGFFPLGAAGLAGVATLAVPFSKRPVFALRFGSAVALVLGVVFIASFLLVVLFAIPFVLVLMLVTVLRFCAPPQGQTLHCL